VHLLRAAHDAIGVGAETALKDDPLLTVRTDPPPARQPLRVVFDSRLRLSPGSALARTAKSAPVIALCAPKAGDSAREGLERAGVRIVETPANAEGLDPSAALAALAALGVSRLFLEGGGRLAASFVSAGLVDRLEWFRAPILLGAEGRPALGGLNLARLQDAPRFHRLSLRALGPDIWETYGRMD
jgi:diaminohydroxyphosphoribosylaminopyrimidine deaminase / 5-amino-6-(5-phosphoribosylamino)uracil reductase